MRGDRDVLAVVERAGRERRQHRVGRDDVRMLMTVHPADCEVASWPGAVSTSPCPAGSPESAAISACAFSSKNDSSTTRIWSSESSASADRTRCLRLRRGKRAIGLRRVVDLKLDASTSEVSIIAATALAPVRVDAQIARDGENPGRLRRRAAGSNSAALRQTVSMVSWASSSARASLAPERCMKVLMRGAKYSNSAAKRRGPDARAIAPIRPRPLRARRGWPRFQRASAAAASAVSRRGIRMPGDSTTTAARTEVGRRCMRQYATWPPFWITGG